MLLLQAMTNMGVAVGLLPVTGQTLPWVSMGGTSTIFTAVAFGCILRVSYQNKIEKSNNKPLVDLAEEVPEEDQAFAEVGAID